MLFIYSQVPDSCLHLGSTVRTDYDSNTVYQVFGLELLIWLENNFVFQYNGWN